MENETIYKELVQIKERLREIETTIIWMQKVSRWVLTGILSLVGISIPAFIWL